MSSWPNIQSISLTALRGQARVRQPPWSIPVSTDEHPHDHDQAPDTEQAEPGTEAGEAVAGDEAVTTEAAADEQVAALQEKLLLVHADMQNLRRRAERDVENA